MLLGLGQTNSNSINFYLRCLPSLNLSDWGSYDYCMNARVEDTCKIVWTNIYISHTHMFGLMLRKNDISDS